MTIQSINVLYSTLRGLYICQSVMYIDNRAIVRSIAGSADECYAFASWLQDGIF